MTLGSNNKRTDKASAMKRYQKDTWKAEFVSCLSQPNTKNILFDISEHLPSPPPPPLLRESSPPPLRRTTRNRRTKCEADFSTHFTSTSMLHLPSNELEYIINSFFNNEDGALVKGTSSHSSISTKNRDNTKDFSRLEFPTIETVVTVPEKKVGFRLLQLKRRSGIQQQETNTMEKDDFYE